MGRRRRPSARLLPIIPLLLLLLLLLQAARASDDSPCPMNVSEPAPDGAYQVNDVLWAGNPERAYPPAAYRQVQGGAYRLCTCETGLPCVRKCCGPNAAYVGNSCRPHNESSSTVGSFEVPKFVNASGTVEVHKTGLFHIVYGKLVCARKYRMLPSDDKTDNFRVNEAGWLLNDLGSVIAQPDKFCLEQLSEFDNQVLPIVCSPEESQQPKNDDQSTKMIFRIGLFLSLPFLLSTFLVYALVKDLRNLHGKSLMCHVATLLIAYTSLIAIQFMTNEINYEWCVILAYTMQFSFMASFFWLNVMCFDLWWAFSGFRPLRGNVQEHEEKKFIIYSIYAWGCTFLISILTFFMDTLTFLPSSAIRPEFGIGSCWFRSNEALLLYFYGPISTLLFSNLLMFVHTAIQIIKHMRGAHVFKGSESQKNVNHEKQRFMLYLKLFIVMGVNWLAEIISWKYDSEYWIVTDLGNSLQGLLIFLIFVCKKRVLKLLSQKLCPQFKLFNLSNTASTRTTNSNFSRTSSNTRNNDAVEMSTNNIRNSTQNQVHDFRA